MYMYSTGETYKERKRFVIVQERDVYSFCRVWGCFYTKAIPLLLVLILCVPILLHVVVAVT